MMLLLLPAVLTLLRFYCPFFLHLRYDTSLNTNTTSLLLVVASSHKQQQERPYHTTLTRINYLGYAAVVAALIIPLVSTRCAKKVGQ